MPNGETYLYMHLCEKLASLYICQTSYKLLLPPFQIVGRFGISRYIVFVMYLYIECIYS
jgi:hypothetical protein